jgi:hypothetical protein
MSNTQHDKFYVYEHINTDGTVFYVGKGYKRRAWWSRTRSAGWKKAAANGFEVRIVKANLSENEAYDLEVKLIAQHGRRDLGLGTLENLTNGGDGVRGVCFGQLKERQKETRRQTRMEMLQKWYMAEEQARVDAEKRARRKPKSMFARVNDRQITCLESQITFLRLTKAVEWLKEQGHKTANATYLVKRASRKQQVYGYTWQLIRE